MKRVEEKKKKTFNSGKLVLLINVNEQSKKNFKKNASLLRIEISICLYTVD